MTTILPNSKTTVANQILLNFSASQPDVQPVIHINNTNSSANTGVGV